MEENATDRRRPMTFSDLSLREMRWIAKHYIAAAVIFGSVVAVFGGIGLLIKSISPVWFLTSTSRWERLLVYAGCLLYVSHGLADFLGHIDFWGRAAAKGKGWAKQASFAKRFFLLLFMSWFWFLPVLWLVAYLTLVLMPTIYAWAMYHELVRAHRNGEWDRVPKHLRPPE